MLESGQLMESVLNFMTGSPRLSVDCSGSRDIAQVEAPGLAGEGDHLICPRLKN